MNPEASIPNQIEIIRSYCEQHDMLLKQVLVDEKKTGVTTDKRYEYQKLKEIILQGRVDVVVVAFSDRLARESFEFILTMLEMKRHGVDFISVQENLKGSRMSTLEVTMIGIKNEMENNTRARRVRDGKLQSNRRGNYTFSKPPFGYLIKNRKLEIDVDEATLVQEIFDLYESGLNLAEIERHLAKTKQREGTRWKFITKVLEDPIYTGERDLPPKMQEQIPDGKVTAPPIISEEQFRRVQAIRKETVKKRKPKNFYFLTQGQFVCPNCKGNLSIYGRNKFNSHILYYCKNGSKDQDKACLRMRVIDLDVKVLDFLKRWVEKREMEIPQTNRGEELLRKKSSNEIAFATGKISPKTFAFNSQKIISEYKALGQDDLITPLSKLEKLKSLVREEKMEKIKEYMIRNDIVLTMDERDHVVIYQKDTTE